MIVKTKKAMKRRVGGQICYRESGRVRTDAKGIAEHGLGAAHRSRKAKAATGSPVIVTGYR